MAGLTALTLVAVSASPVVGADQRPDPETSQRPGVRTVGLGAAAADEDAVAVLEGVIEVSGTAAYEGRIVVATFSERGPAVSEMGITQGPDGELRVTRGDSWELGRVAGEAYLQSSPDTLLRLSGVERTPFELERLLRKYAPGLDGTVELDTGPTTLVRLAERETGVTRERLFVDQESGLVVRRETFDREGAPVRVMAFTRLDAREDGVSGPDDGDLEVERRALTPADAEQLRSQGFLIREELPAGYVLVDAHEVEDAAVPTLHLVYSDGLYALSLYQQHGRLAASAVEGAARLTTDAGGHVWRWPGSEPRRVVWTGDRLTFTALTDAPTDELLTVASGLPTSRSPSILDRLGRGLSRVGEWLTPANRST